MNKEATKIAIAIDNSSKLWTTEYFNTLLEMLIDYGIEYVVVIENPIDELQTKLFQEKHRPIRYYDKVFVAFSTFREFDNEFSLTHIYIGIEIVRQNGHKKLLQNDIPVFTKDNAYFLYLLDNNNLGIKECFPFVFTYADNANDIIGVVENILEANNVQ